MHLILIAQLILAAKLVIVVFGFLVHLVPFLLSYDKKLVAAFLRALDLLDFLEVRWDTILLFDSLHDISGENLFSRQSFHR